METVVHIIVTSGLHCSSFLFCTSLYQICCTVMKGALTLARDGHAIQQVLNQKKLNFLTTAFIGPYLVVKLDAPSKAVSSI